jgi:CBS domain-containing protein
MSGATVTLRAIVRRPLLGQTGERVGQVRDLVARLPERGYPRVAGLVARIGERDVFVAQADVASLEPGAVRLSANRVDLRSFERRPQEILLAGDLLDHHVISVADARLVRVQDITLGSTDSEAQVIGVLVTRRPLWERLLLRTLGHSSSQVLIDWLNVEPLLGHVPTARRRLPFARVARLHPARLADMVEEASHAEGTEILQAVGENPDLEADVFEELDPEYQVAHLEGRPDAEAAEILATMAPDDAADLLLQLPRERRELILACIPLPALQKLKRLLGYNPDTAGGLMSPDFVAVTPEMTITSVRELVGASRFSQSVLDTVYLVDGGGQLVGAIGVVELLRHRGAQKVGAVASPEPVSVRTHADVPEIAITMTDFNLEILPVLDDEGRLIGVITVDDLLEVMLPQEWRVRVRHYPELEESPE